MFTKRTVSLTGINKETEKICKVKNGFIIGYCDVVYEIHYNIKNSNDNRKRLGVGIWR